MRYKNANLTDYSSFQNFILLLDKHYEDNFTSIASAFRKEIYLNSYYKVSEIKFLVIADAFIVQYNK